MDSREFWDIPDHWTWTQIRSVGDVTAGGTPSTKEPAYWGNEVNWISPADLTGYSAKSISHGAKGLSKLGLQNSSAKVMPAGSVHFSSRAPIGYVAISSEPLATNQGFKSLVPAEGVFNEYAYYYLKGSKQLAEQRASGTTFLELSGTAFGLLPFPLPPTNEQRRIVAKLEELFSEIDKGAENLKTAREQLKVYRQAVLKHAFEGKLTEQWREENKGKLETPDHLFARIKQERGDRYQQQLDDWKAAAKTWKAKGQPGKKPSKPKLPKPVERLDSDQPKQLLALPEGWHWVPLLWLLTLTKKPMTTGPFGTMLKKHEHQPSGVPVLGIENIGRGKFVNGNKIFVTEEKAEELSSFKVFSGELIISRSGTVGEICEIPEGMGRTLISTNLLRVSLNSNFILSPFFVFMFQGGGSVRGQVKELCKGSSRDFLNQSILQSIIFPVCGLDEQREVIRQIDDKLSIVEKLDEEIETNLVRLRALRQSILKVAFSGRLVEQDTNDEPATVLLERIKAEKAVQAKDNN